MSGADLLARPTQRLAHSGRSLLVTDAFAQIPRGGSHGFWLANTRVLSRLQWRIDGHELRPSGVSLAGRDVVCAYFGIPAADTTRPGDVYLQVVHVVGEALRTRLVVTNYGAAARSVLLEVALDADFADLEEAERGTRVQVGPVDIDWQADARRLSLRYRHAVLTYQAGVDVAGDADVTWHDGVLAFRVEAAPRLPVEVELLVTPLLGSPGTGAPPRRALDTPTTPLERLHAELRAEMPVLTTTNATVARAWETATADLAAMAYGLPAAPAAPVAGLPIYVEFFGRDTLTVGWQAALATARPLRDAMLANARFQGRVIDDWRDEEPGKMIHRAGGGPLSDLGEDPFDRYYGDWATAPDFLIMLGQYLAWTGDLATVRRVLPAARAALDWLDRFGDLDRDGFLEYRTRSPRGDKNQGWKDSDDAVVHVNGTIPDNPLATSEIQAYWYAGLQQAAAAFGMAGDAGFALDLLGRARTLRRRFNDAFWMEDENFYAMALAPGGELVRSIASNTGHLFAAGMVKRDRAPRVADRLFAPDMFSGWGIRTLSSDHPRYHPFSYHLGSVWPVEQGTIALGLARYGLWEHLHRLAEGVFAATDLFVSNRLPEAIGGLPRDAEHPHPGVYPNSCEPQAWSASTIVLLVQALLGLAPLAPLGTVIVDPHLPAWLPDLRLEGVRVGDAVFDLDVRRRRDGRTSYRVTRRRGRVRVVRQPPPQADAGVGSRVAALIAPMLGR
ncbi:MAG: hypothetical protein M3295_08690 [Chloroflexota bacterium]|nr:hypothetical protein [Chloroflexota bacterium]